MKYITVKLTEDQANKILDMLYDRMDLREDSFNDEHVKEFLSYFPNGKKVIEGNQKEYAFVKRLASKINAELVQ